MRIILFILIFLIAVSAILSGTIMIIYPDGEILKLPLGLLDGTPFKNYLLPGILLSSIVGGVNLLALLYYLKKRPIRYNLAIAGGTVACVWILVQMLLIGTFYWLHFIYLGTGLFIVLIAYQLKGKWAV